MIRNKLIGLFITLLALLLTGCTAGHIAREYHGDAAESAQVSGYSGSIEREVSGSNGQAVDFNVSLSPQNGRILITIVDCYGTARLSLNERATLDEDNTMLVTVPAAGQPYTLRIHTERFTGEYEVSWADSAENYP